MTALLMGLFAWQLPKAAHANICSCTEDVRDAIVQEVRRDHAQRNTGLDKNCTNVTASDLQKVTDLTVGSREKIETLKAVDFSGLSNLERLYIDGTGLTSLSAEVFPEDLSNLIELRLGGNQLTSLPASLFSELSNLKHLYLDRNQLKNLPTKTFSGLSSLVALYLDNNELTNLSEDVFSILSRLDSLHRSNNQLANVPAEVFSKLFSGLSRLIFLDLSNNGLTSIPPNTFRGLEKSEAGGTATIQMRLATQPTAAVIVTPRSNDITEGTVSGPLTFTPSNWDTDQSVTVIGVDDAEVDGDQTYQITFSVTSSDPDYNGIDVAPLVVTSRDDNDPSHRAMAVKAAKQALDTWLPGLGHTVAEQALDAVQGRFQPRPQSSLEWNLAGQSMVGTPLDQHLLAWAKGRGAVTEQQLVEGTSFDLALAPENGAAPGFSFWARGDLARFDREEDDLSLDGNVTTALVGGDWGTEQWSAGAALARSWSSGSYNSGEEEGELSDGSLTALLPYGHYELNPQLSLWGMAGYGWGNLSLTPEGQQAMETMETDINLSLAAVGLEGLLLDGGREGLSIRSTADALLVKVSSEESGALAETESDVSRLRLGLEAVRSFLLEDDASLAPMVEVALRQDGGDAETGFGLDLGAGLDWSAPRQGIRAELEGRVLLYHAAEGFQASGIAASLEWDPTPSTERGPSLSLKHGVGAATGGGMAALLSPAKLPELASSASSQGHQFQALLGYGFAPWGEEGLSIRPEIGLGLSSRGREYNLSWSTFPSVQSGEDSGWEVSTTVKRQENNDSHPSATHSLALHFSLLL